MHSVLVRIAGLVLVCGTVSGAAQTLDPSQLTSAQRSQLRSIALACRSDLQTYCANAPRGNGQVLACIEQNADRISPACQAKLPEAEALLHDLTDN